MRYVIAYDICEPKRLRRVARCLEKHAIRTQKSVFLFQGSQEKLLAVLDEIREMIDERHDCVQAWRLVSQQPRLGMVRGTSAYLYPDSAVVCASGNIFISRPGTNGEPK